MFHSPFTALHSPMAKFAIYDQINFLYKWLEATPGTGFTLVFALQLILIYIATGPDLELHYTLYTAWETRRVFTITLL